MALRHAADHRAHPQPQAHHTRRRPLAADARRPGPPARHRLPAHRRLALAPGAAAPRRDAGARPDAQGVRHARAGGRPRLARVHPHRRPLARALASRARRGLALLLWQEGRARHAGRPRAVPRQDARGADHALRDHFPAGLRPAARRGLLLGTALQGLGQPRRHQRRVGALLPRLQAHHAAGGQDHAARARLGLARPARRT
mmetsp:Transcript_3595/g.9293  ORF Transcript_3595/g.9293 Transcript_3595/m.9293 type:complete len:201 (+) Transcript_3595:367-969(+)